ncbi:MAG: hypothetical protein A3F18_06255 [Legionellales bacterium RIFCSPHIGHO2_12_FULL_37_14]|nr:MAG: hypothetical protein A3F18_06255 [Legionellales bacterium RIFCSPHIGHO2_12_FULL_37_14]
MSLNALATQEEWLKVLEGRTREEINLDLGRVKILAERLKVLNFACSVITVAGTNGKGSTVRALEATYISAGYKVGVYTSPHILFFNERITINQQQIDSNSLCLIFEQIIAAEQGITLTYFEVATLAAFVYFKAHKPDLIILEVGLGGRLDATNIIDADLAIISTISFDHEAYLGKTLDAIGYEKAGIFKKNQKVILASANLPSSVFEVLAEKNIVPLCYQEDYFVELGANKFQFKKQDFLFAANRAPNLHPQAVGAAIMATLLLQDKLFVPINALENALTAKLPARLEYIPMQHQADILLDVAHNIEAVSRLKAYLAGNFAGKKIHAVFSALSDKPIAAMLEILWQDIYCWHIGLLHNKRASPKAQLVTAFQNLPITSILWYNSPSSAFQGARKQTKKGELIVVFGSFHTVADVVASSDTLNRRKSYETNIG